ncbi:hypothetical protein BDW66DRAFT_38755 [Aspergillus desertorum]
MWSRGKNCTGPSPCPFTLMVRNGKTKSLATTSAVPIVCLIHCPSHVLLLFPTGACGLGSAGAPADFDFDQSPSLFSIPRLFPLPASQNGPTTTPKEIQMHSLCRHKVKCVPVADGSGGCQLSTRLGHQSCVFPAEIRGSPITHATTRAASSDTQDQTQMGKSERKDYGFVTRG